MTGPNEYTGNVVPLNDHRGLGRGGRGPLPPGGDGPTFDDMEPRVAKLEASVAHIERDVGEVRADLKVIGGTMADARERLARLEERVAHLPGKGFIVTCTTITLGLMVAVATLAPKLQALFGVVKP